MKTDRGNYFYEDIRRQRPLSLLARWTAVQASQGD